jgi:predicted RNA binding protein YcfA (HicA-like mRNA interferase family)
LIKKIEADGWQYMYTTGSHRHFKHPEKTGKVTIPGHPGDDVTPGTLKSVLKQAGLK